MCPFDFPFDKLRVTSFEKLRACPEISGMTSFDRACIGLDDVLRLICTLRLTRRFSTGLSSLTVHGELVEPSFDKLRMAVWGDNMGWCPCGSALRGTITQGLSQHTIYNHTIYIIQ